MKPTSLSADMLFKRGSAWTIPFRRLADGVPVDLTGLAIRAMFRANTEDGPVVATLTNQPGGGITHLEGGGHWLELLLMPEQTVNFAPGDKILFDVEMTPSDGRVWQSPTYSFRVDQEITRDD